MTERKGYGDLNDMVVSLLLDWDVKHMVDIGAGSGTIGKLAKEAGVLEVEGVEAFAPYIEDFNLRSVYDVVHRDDAVNWLSERAFASTGYTTDAFTMVDVFEHLSTAEARKVLQLCRLMAPITIVVVPWRYPQGAVEHVSPDGTVTVNVWEIHRQADLTPSVMAQRYPELKCVTKGPRMGMYVAMGINEEVVDAEQ